MFETVTEPCWKYGRDGVTAVAHSIIDTTDYTCTSALLVIMGRAPEVISIIF